MAGNYTPARRIAAEPSARPPRGPRADTARKQPADPKQVTSNDKAAAEPQSPPAEANVAPAPQWDDAPLPTKMKLLVLLAAIGGVGAGYLESHLGHRIWPLLAGLLVVILPLLILAQRWVCNPVDRLLKLVSKTLTSDRPMMLDEIVAARSDEVGRLARALHEFSTAAVRERYEARQLRRTLDERIETATKQATRNLKDLAMRDALTELGNRRFLAENLKPLFESCRDAHCDLICLAIDLDRFKQINDTLGHAVGDELLKFLGTLIRGLIRHEDYAIRLGGDEFIVLMPACTVDRGQHLAEQMLALFRQQVKLVIKGDLKPDLSIGVASMNRERVKDGEALIKAADKRLYDAKRAGRGQVVGK